MATSKIEWTNATWNPLAGCTEISPGCTNCYAAVMAHRLAAMGQRKYMGTTRKLSNGKIVWTDKINLDAPSLKIPLEKKKPTMWFVNSMSDLFHKDVPDEFIDQVFAVMALCPQHTFQVLTKRADRMQEYFAGCVKDGKLDRRLGKAAMIVQSNTVECDIGGALGFHRLLCSFKGWPWPLPNVWLGVSVENQKAADERITHLLKTTAAVRFVSAEPLLAPVDLRRVQHNREYEIDALTGDHGVYRPLVGRSEFKLDWVILGGESGGHGARQCNVEWILDIKRQCVRASVPVFVKQLGSNAVVPYYERDGHELRDWALDFKDEVLWPGGSIHSEHDGQPPPGSMIRVKLKSKGGDIGEWPEELQVRQFPETAVEHA